MAEIFGNDIHCFTVVALDASPAGGASLVMGGANGASIQGGSEPVLVTGYTASQNESLSFAKTFGGGVHVYAFGHNPANSILDVQIIGLLHHGGEGKVRNAYKSGRISESMERAAFLPTPAATPWSGFVIGLQTATEAPLQGIQRYTIRLALAEVGG